MPVRPMSSFGREFAAAWAPGEAQVAIANLAAAAIVVFLLYRFIRRAPWPRPLSFRFMLLSFAAALATGVAWLVLSTALATLLVGSQALVDAVRWWPQHIFLGGFLYAVVFAITYPLEASARLARAEALAAHAQLAALRAQLHPHFLFNALHAVVQLIPVDPARATESAEILASLLRTTLEEDRDEIALGDEWDFVTRYLELEHMRFGERLRIRADIDPGLLEERVPAFALQTLVENAVRHGAAPRVAATEIVVAAAASASRLTLTVRNTGDRLAAPGGEGAGTGLKRLRDRLAFLYGRKGTLVCGGNGNGGFEAILSIPRGPRVP